MTQLRLRFDWGLVRFLYLPAIVAGAAATKYLWPLLVFTMRTGLCRFLYRWGQHIEEWFNRKPLMEITDYGLLREDGGEVEEFPWHDILSVAMRRRDPEPPWKTGELTGVGPPFWLSITVRDPDAEKVELSSPGGYRKAYDQVPQLELEGAKTITIWPRQVQGGLYSLMRFAKELQRHLLERADRGEIERLMPGEE